MARTETQAKPITLPSVVREFLSAPFQSLPAAFGESVTPEMRVFEAEAAEAQHRGARAERSVRVRHEHSRPARQDESLERQ
jgi:hypothetical protein